MSCLRGLGRLEEARAAALRSIDVIERHIRLHPADTRAIYLGACGWATLGEKERTLVWARRALAMAPTDCAVRYNVACAFGTVGLVDEALDLLEANVKAGWGSPEWIASDPDLQPLRGNPRFATVRDTIRRRGSSPPS